MSRQTQTATDLPCRCHRNLAYIAPTHFGHCCFHPGAACHPGEFAEWRQRYEHWHGPNSLDRENPDD